MALQVAAQIEAGQDSQWKKRKYTHIYILKTTDKIKSRQIWKQNRSTETAM